MLEEIGEIREKRSEPELPQTFNMGIFEGTLFRVVVSLSGETKGETAISGVPYFKTPHNISSRDSRAVLSQTWGNAPQVKEEL